MLSIISQMDNKIIISPDFYFFIIVTILILEFLYVLKQNIKHHFGIHLYINHGF